LEQITGEYIRNFLKGQEIEFQSTHAKLCLPIIKRMCNKMKYGIRFGEIKVSDNLIIDGHHRYVSSLITSFNIDRVPCHKTSATVILDWEEVEFDENDWDTVSRVSFLNKQDAAYNSVDIETLKKLTTFEK
jgi:hypothetical protein